jgi:hypothetical protein
MRRRGSVCIRKLGVRAMPPEGYAAAARGGVRRLHGLAHRDARSRLDGARHAGPLRGASAEPRRVSQRDPRSAGLDSTSPICCRAMAATSGSTTSPRRCGPRRCSSSAISSPRSGSARWPLAIRTRARGRPSTGSTATSRRAATCPGSRSARAAARSSRTCSPPTASTELFGRLVRGIEEGYAGVEGNDTPDTFIITIDGEEVFSAEIGGPEDHEVQARDMNEARVIHRRPHDGHARPGDGRAARCGFTFRERPFERQDVWEPARRDSQEIHMIGGLPKLRPVGIEGPYDVTGVSRRRAAIGSSSVSRLRRDESACAERIFLQLARRAYPASGHDGRHRGAARVLPQAREQRRHVRRRHPGRRRAHPRQSALPLSHRARSGRRAGGRRAPDQRRRAGLAAVVLPLEQHSRRGADRRWPSAGRLRAPGVLEAGRSAG